MSFKNWKVKDIDRKLSSTIESKYGVPSFIADILSAREFNTVDKIENFLYCDETFYNPYLLKDMDKAVERINQAIENQELIVVYGDYDCDGISATSLLTLYLDRVGARVAYYIPPRTKGYGLNNNAIKVLKDKGVDLIITVDNGITAIEQIDYANEIGLDVVVTDHHATRDTIPNAVACVNPQRKDCQYPFKSLCGAGVALKLICALEDDLECTETVYNFAHLAGLGTVADIVELTGENRAIVKIAMDSIRDNDFAGINALLKVSGLKKEVTSTNIAFGLSPRINASGRVGNPSKAVDILMSDDIKTSDELANLINNYNIKRKEIEEKIYKEVLIKISENRHIIKERVLIVSGEGWDSGVIGIVCSKLVNKFSKPCILITCENGEARGSARSVYGYNMVQAISSASDILTKYGGHTMAAGFSLLPENIELLKHKIYDYSKQNHDIMPADIINIDRHLDAEDITIENARKLDILEPFGEGNPTPVFLIKDAVINGVYPLSKGKHTKINIIKDKCYIDILCFGKKTENFDFEYGDEIDVVATMSINEYGDNISVSLIAKDINLKVIDKNKIHNANELYEKFLRDEQLPKELSEKLIPTREDIAKVYKYMRKNKFVKENYILLSTKLSDIGYFKIKVAVDILLKEKLIIRGKSKNIVGFIVEPKPVKVNLENSLVLQKLKKLV